MWLLWLYLTLNKKRKKVVYNLLQFKTEAGMQSVNWLLYRMEGTNLTVVVENEEKVELSFTRMWDPSLKRNPVPLNIDKRYLFTWAHFVISRFQSMTIIFLERQWLCITIYLFSGSWCFVVPQDSTPMPFMNTWQNHQLSIWTILGLH